MMQRKFLFHLIFLLSGVAGLGYQMVWTRMFTLSLGHEMPSVLAVITAFFGGLALGAWLLDKPIAKSSRPAGWYVGLELLIGVWGFASLALIPKANELALLAIGIDPSPARHWLIAFFLPFLVLLPATLAMGATLPAMERCAAPRERDGRCVGGLYAANTAGAMLGTLLSAFLIIPYFGYKATLVLLALVNIVCALSMLPLAWQRLLPTSQFSKSEHQGVSRTRLGITVFLTGLLGIGYEVLGIRLMSQVAENTVYSFAVALIVYLAGTALGASLYQRFGKRISFDTQLTVLLCGISAGSLASVALIEPAIKVYIFLRDNYGTYPISIVIRELMLGVCLFAVPTVFMGATYAHIVQAAKRDDGGIGSAAAVNTLGGSLAPPLFGVWLLPYIGSKWAITALALAYLALIPKINRRLLPVAVLPVLIALALPARLYPVRVTEGGQIIEHREGVMATVTIVENKKKGRSLAINNRFNMGGTAAATYEKRQALLPLLLHGSPERVMILGVGTGITCGGALSMPSIEIDAVELIPEVIEFLGAFEPENESPQQNTRARLFTADARRFVRSGSDKYDVVVADLFHPARDGAGMLFTVEQFRAIRNRTKDDGLFCQWLPLHQLDENSLRIIIRTFLEVFPNAMAFLVNDSINAPALGLIGVTNPTARKDGNGSTTLDDAAFLSERAELGLADRIHVDGQFLAGAAELSAYAQDAQINTDDHPIVMFRIPYHVYDVRRSRHGRLKSMLDKAASDPARYVFDRVAQHGEGYAKQLTAYVAARNAYLKGRIAEVEGRKKEALSAFVQSVRLSPDFDSGYDRSVRAARNTSPANRKTAIQLLEILVDLRPNLEDARDALAELVDSSN